METFRRLGFDKALCLITLVLVAIGIMMVFSSSAYISNEKYHQPFYFLLHQTLGAFLGLFLMFAVATIKKPFFQNPFFVLGLLFVTLGLLMLCLLMPTIARTNRWIVLFGIRFQPSELAKISLVLFFSYYLQAKNDRLHEWKTLLVPLAVLFAVILLVCMEPNFSAAMLITGISVMMLVLGGVKWKHFVFLGVVLAVFSGLFLIQADYRVERIHGFLSPDKDPLGNNYQVIQSKMAVGSGGLLGASFGESTQKLFFLPFAHTDFIFAILGEEFGLAGTVVSLALFLAFLWRGLVIASRASNSSYRLIAAGLTMTIVAQALLNISVVLGLGPPTGIPLPFISYGRSSLVTNLAAVGILLNISGRKGDLGGRV